MKLSEVKISKTCSIADIEFIKVSEENGIACLVAKEAVFDSAFGKNNNFGESDILTKLNTKVLPKLESTVGAENIKEFDLDLTSLDGLDTYGSIKTKIAIPTIDFYRKNVRIFDKYKMGSWWWLSTPDTTPEHYNNRWNTCVSPDGSLDYDYCNGLSGVRPFLFFDSSISVSCEE